MNPGEDDRGAFRRNVLIIAALHVVVIGGLWLFFVWKNEATSGETVAWLDGGGPPAGGENAQPTPAAEDTPQEEETPSPTPPPDADRMPTPGAEESAPPSQIVIPAPAPLLVAVPTPELTPTPEPTATPTPRPTPKPTPRPSPKPKPKASASASPKPKPKSKPKSSASPKKHSTPKASPHKSPSPGDQDNASDDDATQAAKAAFKKSTGHTAADGGDGTAGTAPGSGGGHRGGAGHAGGGATQSDFGWYQQLLYKKFYDGWTQPTSIVTSTSSFSTLVKIRIEKDGTISDVSLAQSSGNDVMDQSVMEAARRVTHVDPLPEGLGDGGAYEVKINFELSQPTQ